MSGFAVTVTDSDLALVRVDEDGELCALNASDQVAMRTTLDALTFNVPVAVAESLDPPPAKAKARRARSRLTREEAVLRGFVAYWTPRAAR